MAQIGRNDPCPCGGGKKYKQCCLQAKSLGTVQHSSTRSESPPAETLPPGDMNRLAELFHARKFVEMECAASALLGFHPNSGFAWRALGAALRLQNKEALHALQRAAELLPHDPESFNNLGNALQDSGRVEEAMASYRRALALRPDFPEANNNLGNAFREIGQLDNAVACFRRALAQRPGYPEANNNLGLVLQDVGQINDAVACYRVALRGNPDFAEAHGNLGNALKDLGRLDEAVASCRRALELNPGAAKVHDNLLMALQFQSEIAARDLFEAHKRFGEQYEPPLKPYWPAHTNSRDPGKRLKVGYVSGDLREHAVASFIEPALVNHDKTQVQVFCYANSRIQDDVTKRLKAAADHWQPCAGMSDDELARQIRADGIDILVDLAGHTAHNRLLVFARKPAPIQITYLGYLGSSGLSAMDYRLTDNYAEPDGYDRYYTEKLLRLPDSQWCYRPPEETGTASPITPLPALANGYLTFGSFNNINKVSRETIELWASLLRSLPSSRLLMVAPQEIRQSLTERFLANGVCTNRIGFCGKTTPEEFRRTLQQVDISLDPFPNNGATTTCESLWQGVPVLNLVGTRHLSRNGLSVLSAAGMGEFAVATQEEYIQVATKLANDLPRLAEIRAGMRERLKGTPLLDQQRFTRNLESIYREVWRGYASA